MDARSAEVVRMLYRELLGREPDLIGWTAFASAWAEGRGQDVVEAMLSSIEFQRRSSWRQRQAGRLRLGFVHVPKTGGASLLRVLSELLPIGTPQIYFMGADDFSKRRRRASWGGMPASHSSLSREVHDSPVVMGHFAAGQLISAGCTKLVLSVREPRARLLSLYRFWQSLPGEQFSAPVARALGGGLSSFLASPYLEHAVRDVIAAHSVSAAPVWRRGESAARLWRNIDDFIGLAVWPGENAKALEYTLKSLGEWHGQTIPEVRVNVTSHQGQTTEQLREQDLFRLDALTRADSQVLELLMGSGKLTAKSSKELDDDFASACMTHRFTLP